MLMLLAHRSIEKNPMRLQSLALDVPLVRWLVLDQQGETERGRMIRLEESSALDRDMFSLIWGPTVAAVSVVLDQVALQFFLCFICCCFKLGNCFYPAGCFYLL